MAKSTVNMHNAYRFGAHGMLIALPASFALWAMIGIAIFRL